MSRKDGPYATLLDSSAQVFPKSDIVPAGGTFRASQEWIQLRTLNPQQASGAVQLVSDRNELVVVGEEPFYVTDSRAFRINTGADTLLTRAPRRELLSVGPFRDYPANGAAFSELLEIDFGPFSIGSSDWLYVYLDSNGNPQTRITTAGTIDAGDVFPFGWASPKNNFRGRYYNIEFYTFGLGGNQSVEIAHDMSGINGPLYVGPSISLQRTAPYGHCHVGDSASATLAGPTFSVSNYSQQVALGSKSWTLIIRPAAALAEVSGTFRVIRLGF